MSDEKREELTEEELRETSGGKQILLPRSKPQTESKQVTKRRGRTPTVREAPGI